MRFLTNNCLADVIYYMTEHHGQIIVDIIANIMNQKYHEYLTKYPNAFGSISIFGVFYILT
jgi:hypothetical protein